MKIYRTKRFTDPEKYTGIREEWDYERLKKKPDQFLKNSFRDPTERECKNIKKNRAILYGSHMAVGAALGSKGGTSGKGAAIGAVAGGTLAAGIDAYGRHHRSKRAKVARTEWNRRHPGDKKGPGYWEE